MNLILVILVLGALMVGVHRLKLSPEWSRKSIHLGMGIVVLSFPWIFSEPWEVDLLAAIAVLGMVALRWFKPSVGEVLHRIERLSFGEILFPVGVAVVFRLSGGNLETYLPAIAVLTFADTAGAIIGRRFGRHPYRTNAGEKSVEGSLAVFLVAVVVTFFPLAWHGTEHAILISIVVGLVAAMAEGVLGAGIDNLVLPLAVFALVHFLRELPGDLLLMRILLICVLSALLIGARKLTSLNGGGLLCSAIFGYLCFALGGGKFLLPPIILFAIHLITTIRFPELSKLEHSAESVSSIAIPGLVWISLKISNTFPEEICWHGFTLTLMAQVAFLHAATRQHLNRSPDSLICAVKVLLVGLPLLSAPLLLTATFAMTLVARILESLTRPDQAILAFLLSLSILIP